MGDGSVAVGSGHCGRVGVWLGVGELVSVIAPSVVLLGVGLGVFSDEPPLVVGVGDVEADDPVAVGVGEGPGIDPSRPLVGVGELFVPPPSSVAVGTGLSSSAFVDPSPLSRNASPIILNFSDPMPSPRKSIP